MKPGHAFALIALTAVGLLMVGCGSSNSHGKRHDSAPEVAVTVGQVTAGDGSVVSGLNGAAEEVTITARVQGRLTRLPKDEGEHFRYGDALALFESQINQAALDAAREALESAQLDLEQAERQRDRMEKLHQSRVASERELEIAQSELEAAQAAYAGANAGYQRLLDSVTLRAPFDGVVVLHRVDPGTIVSPGQPILHIRSHATSANSAPATGAEPTLWVPSAALFRRGGLVGVFVVEEDHAVLRWIRTGGASDGVTEVLSGLQEGESVVLEPAQLVDGQPVRMVQ
jgi:multidrug efflux pump subunit AcrA (membrane-fusion protein)